jgi:hypothetical protein
MLYRKAAAMSHQARNSKMVKNCNKGNANELGLSWIKMEEVSIMAIPTLIFLQKQHTNKVDRNPSVNITMATTKYTHLWSFYVSALFLILIPLMLTFMFLYLRAKKTAINMNRVMKDTMKNQVTGPAKYRIMNMKMNPKIKATKMVPSDSIQVLFKSCWIA